MSFIVQEIPAPTVFKVGKVETAQAASGTVNFYVGEQDILIYNQNATNNWNLNLTYDPTTSLDVAMGSGDVASVTFGAKMGSVAYLQQAITIDGTQSGVNFAFQTSSPIGLTSGINYYNIEVLKQTELGPFYVTVEYDFTRPFASGLPGAPTGVSAATAGLSAATITYLTPTTPSDYPILQYQVSGSTGITGFTAGNSITLSATFNVPVSYKVKARNAFGYGPESASSNTVTPGVPASQIEFVTAGSYTWIVPSDLTTVSVVAVGGGGQGSENGGGGGGLGWKNNITVSPGSGYTVVVGAAGGQSYFLSSITVAGNGGNTNGTGGTKVGDGGGNGGAGGSGFRSCGGGGAGGYAGNGGVGGVATVNSGTGGNGTGGAAGGGGAFDDYASGSGGGVGLLGQGASGNGNTTGGGGFGGSGGANGGGAISQIPPVAGPGGLYGGGGGGIRNAGPGGGTAPGTGAVRIIWSGTSGITRAFPSTNTGNY